jgi:hypothetical protein
MANRCMKMTIKLIATGERVGKRIGSTSEYIPDTKPANQYGLWAAYVPDANISDVTTAMIDEIGTVDVANP